MTIRGDNVLVWLFLVESPYTELIIARCLRLYLKPRVHDPDIHAENQANIHLA